MAAPVKEVESTEASWKQQLTADGWKLKDPRGMSNHVLRSLSSFQNIAQCGDDYNDNISSIEKANKDLHRCFQAIVFFDCC